MTPPLKVKPPQGLPPAAGLMATLGGVAFGAMTLERMAPLFGPYAAPPTVPLFKIAVGAGLGAAAIGGGTLAKELRGLWGEWGLRRTWGLPTYRSAAAGALPIWIGFTERGWMEAVSLEAVEGLVIAGQPGSGKSSAVRAILCGFVEWTRPSACRLAICDLKGGVEFSWLRKAPHVRAVATTLAQAADLIAEIDAAVDRRLLLMEKADTDDCAEVEGLGRVVLVVDEARELSDDEEIIAALTRIAARGRAAGVHLIMATQRPDREALPGAIKACIPASLCFRVRNEVNSQIVIDHPGAEDLPLCGTAIWQWQQTYKVRVPFLSRKQAKARVSAAIARAAAEDQQRPGFAEVARA